MKPIQHALFGTFLVCALAGAVFSGFSARDSIAHLDRQIHAVTCSYVPGLESDATGQSGCYHVMMSPYSSVLRDATWGGIPIAVPSLSVFAFLLFLGLDAWRRGFGREPWRMWFLAAAALLPAAVSVIYWVISVAWVGTLCKNCLGIYAASFGALAAAAGLLWLSRRSSAERGDEAGRGAGMPWRWWGLSFAEGVLFVSLPIAVFAMQKPAYTDEMAACGSLLQPQDKYGIQLPVHRNPAGIPAVELTDPLCPACRAFRDRLRAGGLEQRLDLKVVLFPLDSSCNWMVNETIHPGACKVAEAVVCAGERARAVLDWTLDNQDELRRLATESASALDVRLAAAFPELAGCLGTPSARSKINKSLRWIVANSARVTTPQLFVGGRRLCDEDTDLGLEFALGRLLDAMGEGPTPAAESATGGGR
ncbi:MAG TPA: vitamin K epoxide reductase family protein [Polyangia bacterium]|nr:vitamin K epoxide reductase family protein [Polyangia bacterium]